MNSRQKTKKLLESFLSEREVDGICGYFIDDEINDDDERLAVYVIIDEDFERGANTKPGFVAKMMRAGVQNEIKKWLNIDVYVGSTVRKCNEEKSMNESVVYDYEEGRNEAPERLPFDIKKLIDVGAVFVTPAIEGDPNSKHYKKFLKRPYTHLITLHNLKKASPDSWVHKAVTRFASPKQWDSKDFSKNLYDGKYNQILWSLDELGIPYESMLIDDIKESKKDYIVTESQLNLILETRKNIDLFQKLIDTNMDYIRKGCEDVDQDYLGVISDESCNQLESISKVDVTEAEWSTIKHSNSEKEYKMMSIRLMIYYTSNRQYGQFDADDITYDLEQMLRKSTGMPIIVNYDSTNTNKHFDW